MDKSKQTTEIKLSVLDQTEDAYEYCIDKIVIMLSKETKDKILKAQQIMVDNPFISTIMVNCEDKVEYLNDEGFRTRYQSGVEYFLFHKDGDMSFYSEHKHNEQCMLYSEWFKLERLASIFVHKREFGYGWDFTEFDEHGRIVTYETEEEANALLSEYIKETNEAYKNGDLSDPYQDDVKVFAVTPEEITEYYAKNDN